MEREMHRLEELMGGLENMTREPDVIIIDRPDSAPHGGPRSDYQEDSGGRACER